MQWLYNNFTLNLKTNIIAYGDQKLNLNQIVVAEFTRLKEKFHLELELTWQKLDP